MRLSPFDMPDEYQATAGGAISCARAAAFPIQRFLCPYYELHPYAPEAKNGAKSLFGAFVVGANEFADGAKLAAGR